MAIDILFYSIYLTLGDNEVNPSAKHKKLLIGCHTPPNCTFQLAPDPDPGVPCDLTQGRNRGCINSVTPRPALFIVNQQGDADMLCASTDSHKISTNIDQSS